MTEILVIYGFYMIENSVMKELRKAIVCKIVQVIVINTKLPLQFEIENKSQ